MLPSACACALWTSLPAIAPHKYHYGRIEGNDDRRTCTARGGLERRGDRSRDSSDVESQQCEVFLLNIKVTNTIHPEPRRKTHARTTSNPSPVNSYYKPSVSTAATCHQAGDDEEEDA
ncbi:hypothetical protein PsYK624_155880 [Phanerochaete sordida]|uniref:Uncharacterized protein n=1 Tax=Phanerochaete sordida TaxID=48140 RepID=A0A9P3GTE7_9APHY|nr:hypothetical protein PsYK624_155880 [Phanerochaete sordida]